MTKYWVEVSQLADPHKKWATKSNQKETGYRLPIVPSLSFFQGEKVKLQGGVADSLIIVPPVGTKF